jgi:mycothiol synthase
MPRRIRPPSPTDAPAVLDLILARDVADVGAPDFTLEDLEADWSRPGVALEHDARVAVGPGGGIRGALALYEADAGGRAVGEAT